VYDHATVTIQIRELSSFGNDHVTGSIMFRILARYGNEKKMCLL